MMSRHFALNSVLTGAIVKKLPHAKNQPSAPGSFNQFVIYIYIHNNRVLKLAFPIGILFFIKKLPKVLFNHFRITKGVLNINFNF